jgi:hypothetical protein
MSTLSVRGATRDKAGDYPSDAHTGHVMKPDPNEFEWDRKSVDIKLNSIK